LKQMRGWGDDSDDDDAPARRTPRR
jgi:hypothetical protein